MRLARRRRLVRAHHHSFPPSNWKASASGSATSVAAQLRQAQTCSARQQPSWLPLSLLATGTVVQRGAKLLHNSISASREGAARPVPAPASVSGRRPMNFAGDGNGDRCVFVSRLHARAEAKIWPDDLGERGGCSIGSWWRLLPVGTSPKTSPNSIRHLRVARTWSVFLRCAERAAREELWPKWQFCARCLCAPVRPHCCCSGARCSSQIAIWGAPFRAR